jgi:hypothetical protein
MGQLTTLEAADLVTLGSRVSFNFLGRVGVAWAGRPDGLSPIAGSTSRPSRPQELVVEEDIAETPTAATGRDVVRQP